MEWQSKAEPLDEELRLQNYAVVRMNESPVSAIGLDDEPIRRALFAALVRIGNFTAKITDMNALRIENGLVLYAFCAWIDARHTGNITGG